MRINLIIIFINFLNNLYLTTSNEFCKDYVKILNDMKIQFITEVMFKEETKYLFSLSKKQQRATKKVIWLMLKSLVVWEN